MARASGANAILAGAFENLYGQPPVAGWAKLPFVSHNMGEERGYVADDLLGYGREPLPPSQDVANNDGDVVVPVDLRNFGYWLKLAFGAPVSVDAGSASGTFTFSAQPANNSKVTVGGTDFTFTGGAPNGNQVQIGATLTATVTALAAALTASTVPAVMAATYAAAAGVLTITAKAAGPGGNAIAISAGAGSNAKASGATLAGGSRTHTFTSGAQALTSLALEFGHPEVPSYGMNFGCRLNTLKIGLSRSGLLNATVNIVAKGETLAAAPASGDPAALPALPIERFSQAMGEIKRNGVQLGQVVSADFTYSNNLDKVETIKPDGRIEDADPGKVADTGSIVARFADTALLDQAAGGQPCELSFGWSIGPGKSLLITKHSVFLPRAKRPVSGPTGVQATFPWHASADPTLNRSVTIVLTNDVAGY